MTSDETPAAAAAPPLTIRGLTIQRPWAGAIVHGGKRIENRTWYPAASLMKAPGLWLAIHAGAHWDAAGAELCLPRWPRARDEVMGGDRAGEFPLRDERSWPKFARAKGIVGVARVEFAAPIADLGAYLAKTRGGRAMAATWAAGPLCWVLRDVRPLPWPIPCRGALGLWALEPAALEAVAPWCVREPRNVPW